MIENQSIIILKNFYKKLKNNLLRDKGKLKNNSVLWTLIESKLKDIEKILKESHYSTAQFDSQILKILSEQDLIIPIYNEYDDSNNYIITATGIWEIEKTTNSFTELDLLKFIQKKYFNFEQHLKPLDDKDKLAILSLLCLRNFSQETAMELNSQTHLEHWGHIFTDVFNFLNKNRFLTKSYSSIENIFNSRGSEHKVQYLMRHRNNLAVKSSQIFCNKGESKYYLDIDKNNCINPESIKYSFSLVLTNQIESSIINDLIELCISLANNKSKYVLNNFRFINSNFDQLIKTTLEKLYIERG